MSQFEIRGIGFQTRFPERRTAFGPETCGLFAWLTLALYGPATARARNAMFRAALTSRSRDCLEIGGAGGEAIVLRLISDRG